MGHVEDEQQPAGASSGAQADAVADDGGECCYCLANIYAALVVCCWVVIALHTINTVCHGVWTVLL